MAAKLPDTSESRQTDKVQVSGADVVRNSLRTLPTGPGVYRMFNRRGEPLYVGKARSLRKRVASYANPRRQSVRIERMISDIASLEVISTHTEAEALLLEANLIKQLKPPYNIVLRDDKSHPYILLTGDHDWPQLLKHRGARNKPGRYFGPFASAGAVNRTLNALQRAFPLRTCSDSVFNARTRPCLQYQIKRCTAPCVGLIAEGAYGEIVDQTRDFLAGKSQQVQKLLSERMESASRALEFEAAAVLRDRIRALAHIQAHQGINVDAVGEADVIAAYQDAGQTCIQVFFFRGGRNYGNRAHYPSHSRDDGVEAVLGAFVVQFYDGRAAPRQVMLSHPIEGTPLIEEALSIKADRKVRLLVPQRGGKRRLVEHATVNAREALGRRMAESASQRRLLEGVAEMFSLDAPPRRIEIYDNSHISGTKPVGAMVVAGPEGLIKNAYRKFNIKTVSAGDGSESDGNQAAPGDDYAMMREVLTRRFSRLQRESGDEDSEAWPDLVLLDGGAGQLSSALEVLADLGVAVGPDGLSVAAIAKGPDRNAGRERIHLPGRAQFLVPPSSPVSYFLQRLRDEAHRFAIGTHRARRSKAIGQSELDQIAGVGAKRKRALLHRFGSTRGVADAGLADLATVDGVNERVAQAIYDHFHGGG
jgi:excinuclease ABC subunit C